MPYQQDLLKGLSQLTGSIEELFSQIQPEHLDWRPRENMRTLMELANHLAQVPAVDRLILKGATEAEVRALEVSLRRSSPGELAEVWRSGLQEASAYFDSLTPEQFQTEVGKAFYGHAAPMHEWLLEIITHSYHHRAQLFTYLKLLGRPVDMFTLYI